MFLFKNLVLLSALCISHATAPPPRLLSATAGVGRTISDIQLQPDTYEQAVRAIDTLVTDPNNAIMQDLQHAGLTGMTVVRVNDEPQRVISVAAYDTMASIQAANDQALPQQAFAQVADFLASPPQRQEAEIIYSDSTTPPSQMDYQYAGVVQVQTKPSIETDMLTAIDHIVHHDADWQRVKAMGLRHMEVGRVNATHYVFFGFYTTREGAQQIDDRGLIGSTLGKLSSFFSAPPVRIGGNVVFGYTAPTRSPPPLTFDCQDDTFALASNFGGCTAILSNATCDTELHALSPVFPTGHKVADYCARSCATGDTNDPIGIVNLFGGCAMTKQFLNNDCDAPLSTLSPVFAKKGVTLADVCPSTCNRCACRDHVNELANQFAGCTGFLFNGGCAARATDLSPFGMEDATLADACQQSCGTCRDDDLCYDDNIALANILGNCDGALSIPNVTCGTEVASVAPEGATEGYAFKDYCVKRCGYCDDLPTPAPPTRPPTPAPVPPTPAPLAFDCHDDTFALASNYGGCTGYLASTPDATCESDVSPVGTAVTISNYTVRDGQMHAFVDAVHDLLHSHRFDALTDGGLLRSVLTQIGTRQVMSVTTYSSQAQLATLAAEGGAIQQAFGTIAHFVDDTVPFTRAAGTLLYTSGDAGTARQANAVLMMTPKEGVTDQSLVDELQMIEQTNADWRSLVQDGGLAFMAVYKVGAQYAFTAFYKDDAIARAPATTAIVQRVLGNLVTFSAPNGVVRSFGTIVSQRAADHKVHDFCGHTCHTSPHDEPERFTELFGGCAFAKVAFNNNCDVELGTAFQHFAKPGMTLADVCPRTCGRCDRCHDHVAELAHEFGGCTGFLSSATCDTPARTASPAFGRFDVTIGDACQKSCNTCHDEGTCMDDPLSLAHILGNCNGALSINTPVNVTCDSEVTSFTPPGIAQAGYKVKDYCVARCGMCDAFPTPQPPAFPPIFTAPPTPSTPTPTPPTPSPATPSPSLRATNNAFTTSAHRNDRWRIGFIVVLTLLVVMTAVLFYREHTRPMDTGDAVPQNQLEVELGKTREQPRMSTDYDV